MSAIRVRPRNDTLGSLGLGGLSLPDSYLESLCSAETKVFQPGLMKAFAIQHFDNPKDKGSFIFGFRHPSLSLAALVRSSRHPCFERRRPACESFSAQHGSSWPPVHPVSLSRCHLLESLCQITHSPCSRRSGCACEICLSVEGAIYSERLQPRELFECAQGVGLFD
jgi:hypothetical protein